MSINIAKILIKNMKLSEIGFAPFPARFMQQAAAMHGCWNLENFTHHFLASNIRMFPTGKWMGDIYTANWSKMKDLISFS